MATLKEKGLRTTPRRVALLGALATATSPKTAEEIHARMKGTDLVTVYRNLQRLVVAGLVREVRFKDATARFELADEDSHHHHLVCTACGTVDELPDCDVRGLEKDALRKTKHFATITEHSLEFFGTCKACITT